MTAVGRPRAGHDDRRPQAARAPAKRPRRPRLADSRRLGRELPDPRRRRCAAGSSSIKTPSRARRRGPTPSAKSSSFATTPRARRSSTCITTIRTRSRPARINPETMPRARVETEEMTIEAKRHRRQPDDQPGLGLRRRQAHPDDRPRPPDRPLARRPEPAPQDGDDKTVVVDKPQKRAGKVKSEKTKITITWADKMTFEGVTVDPYEPARRQGRLLQQRPGRDGRRACSTAANRSPPTPTGRSRWPRSAS